MIKAIFFDFGGVLFTSGSKQFTALISQRYALNIDEIDAVFNHSEVGNAYREGRISSEFFWNSIKQSLNLNEDIDVLEEEWIKGFKLIEGTKEILNKLSGKYKVYFLSDNVKEVVNKINDEHNFISWFEGGIFSHEVGIRKPHPDIYKMVLKTAGVDSSEAIFIDDRENNLVPARAMAIKTILFENPAQLKKELRELGVVI